MIRTRRPELGKVGRRLRWTITVEDWGKAGNAMEEDARLEPGVPMAEKAQMELWPASAALNLYPVFEIQK